MTLAVVDLVRQVDRDGHVVEGLKTTHSERPVVVPEPWSLDVLSQPGPWLVGSGERPVSLAVKRGTLSEVRDLIGEKRELSPENGTLRFTATPGVLYFSGVEL